MSISYIIFLELQQFHAIKNMHLQKCLTFGVHIKFLSFLFYSQSSLGSGMSSSAYFFIVPLALASARATTVMPSAP